MANAAPMMAATAIQTEMTIVAFDDRALSRDGVETWREAARHPSAPDNAFDPATLRLLAALCALATPRVEAEWLGRNDPHLSHEPMRRIDHGVSFLRNDDRRHRAEEVLLGGQPCIAELPASLPCFPAAKISRQIGPVDIEPGCIVGNLNSHRCHFRRFNSQERSKVGKRLQSTHSDRLNEV